MAGGSALAKRQTRQEIQASIEDLKRKLAASEERDHRRIGRIADRAGLLDLRLSDDELLHELKGIVARFQEGAGAAQRASPPEGGADAAL